MLGVIGVLYSSYLHILFLSGCRFFIVIFTFIVVIFQRCVDIIQYYYNIIEEKKVHDKSRLITQEKYTYIHTQDNTLKFTETEQAF